jgi:hypothetical protein
MPSKERHKILAQASTEAKVNIHRVRVVPMDLPLLTSFMATAQKYDIIRCENIFQAMLVLRQYLPRTSVIFEDTYTEHGLHVCRTQTARIAWRTFRQENAMKQWYVDLKKEINRHGQYADW